MWTSNSIIVGLCICTAALNSIEALSEYGDVCAATEDCNTYQGSVTCVNLTCSCNLGDDAVFEVDPSNQCVGLVDALCFPEPFPGLGERNCIQNSECIAGGGFLGQCRCKADYTENSERRCDLTTSTENGISTTENGFTTTENSITTTENSVTTTTENSISTTENSISSTDNSISTTENSIGTTENGISTTENSISTTENSISTTENSISTTDNSVTTTENSISTTVNSITTTENSVTTTENSISTTENSLSSTTEVQTTKPTESLTSTENGPDETTPNGNPKAASVSTAPLICILLLPTVFKNMFFIKN